MPIPDDLTQGTKTTPINTTNWNAIIDNVNALKDYYGAGSVFDVTHPDYGAVGDGTTDDTVAIQAAIDAAYAVGGAVFFPPGVYKVSSEIGITASAMDSCPSLIGAHSTGVSKYHVAAYSGVQHGSIIKYTGTGTCIAFKGLSPTVDFHGGVMRDLTIINDYNVTNYSQGRPGCLVAYPDSTIGLHLKRTNGYQIDNVKIIGFNIGFKAEMFVMGRIVGLETTMCYTGMFAVDNFNTNVMVGCRFTQDTIGLLMRGGIGSSIDEINIENTYVGLILDYKTYVDGIGGMVFHENGASPDTIEATDAGFIAGGGFVNAGITTKQSYTIIETGGAGNSKIWLTPTIVTASLITLASYDDIADSSGGTVVISDPSPMPGHLNFNGVYCEHTMYKTMVIGAMVISPDGVLTASSVASYSEVTSSEQIHNIKIDNYRDSPYAAPDSQYPDSYMQLDKVKDIVVLNEPEAPADAIKTTANTVGLVLLTNQINYSFKGRSQYDAEKNRVAFDYPYNLIPNGFNRFPSLIQQWKHPGLSQVHGTVAAGYFEWAVEDSMNVWKIYMANPVTNGIIYHRIRTTDKMWGRGIVLNCRAKRDADSLVYLSIRDSAGAAIQSGAETTIGATWTDANCYATVPASGEFIDVGFRVTNTGAVRYFYVASMVASLDGQGQLQRSPMDYLAGLSGITECDIAGTVVPLDIRFKIGHYGVILTPQANGLAWVVPADNEFTIYTTVDNMNVGWLVIPREGIM